MKPEKSKRLLAFVLIGLVLIVVVVGAAVVLTSGNIRYTDDAVEVELIPPSSTVN
jgi:hypothetical protein